MSDKSPTKFVYRKVFPFTWTVKVPEGVVPAFEFKARYEGLPSPEMEKLRKGEGETLQDADVAARVFKGWVEGELMMPGETADAPPVPMPCTPENIAAVLDLPFMRFHIVSTYFQAMNGVLAKN